VRAGARLGEELFEDREYVDTDGGGVAVSVLDASSADGEVVGRVLYVVSLGLVLGLLGLEGEHVLGELLDLGACELTAR